MSEQDRDEIAALLAKKSIESLGAPWLAQAPPQISAYIPPLLQYMPSPGTGGEQQKTGGDNGDTSGLFSLEGKGESGSIDKMKRPQKPEGEIYARYRKRL